MKSNSLVKNPLTVISIFASLTEIVCGTVTPFISDSQNQSIFLIFVIGFPILLIILFFITLNFNHKVLYAPSDFTESDRDIADLFYGKTFKSEIVEKPSKLLRKDNSLKNIDNLPILDSDRPYFDYAIKFYELIEKTLPLDKFEEINFDFANNIIHTLSIKIKEEYLKEGARPNQVFVLYLSENKLANNEAVESTNQKYVWGLIAGSGHGSEEESIEELVLYVFKTIGLKLK
ncbi:MAG: hypothetical protein U0289_06120 [Cyclobacteriaceae bacterium]